MAAFNSRNRHYADLSKTRFKLLNICHLIYSLSGYKLNGAPERIRTSDPRLRRPMLYPAELRALNWALSVALAWVFSECMDQ